MNPHISPVSDPTTPIAASSASSTRSPVRMFRRKAAANYVRDTWGFPCSNAWLAKLAVVGGGPCFRKAGRYPLYAVEDLDAWASARIGPRIASTSQNG